MTNHHPAEQNAGDETVLGPSEAAARSMLRLVWTLAVIASVGMTAAVAYVARLDGWKILAITPLLVALASVLLRALDSATRSYRHVRDDISDLQLRVLATHSVAAVTPIAPAGAAPATSQPLAS